MPLLIDIADVSAHEIVISFPVALANIPLVILPSGALFA